MFTDTLPLIAPHLLEIFGLLITLLIGWIAKRLRDWTGIQIEARHREALHSALMTGVRYAIERNLPPAAAVDTAVSYAQRIGAPDAIAALGASRDTLGAIARAKMQEAGATQIGKMGN